MSEERDSLFDKIQNRIMPPIITKAYGTNVMTLDANGDETLHGIDRLHTVLTYPQSKV